MQQTRLTPHSLNVLFTLKQLLLKYRLTLESYLFKCFGQNKNEINDQEFETIFRYGDKTLLFEDINKLFSELEVEGVVKVSSLNMELVKVKRPNLMVAKFEMDNEIKKEVREQLREVQGNMLKEDPYLVFDMYDVNKDEKLHLEEINQLLMACSSVLAKQLELRKDTIKWLLRVANSRKIKRQTFFQIFGMQNIPLKIKFDKPPSVQEVQNLDEIAKICLMGSKIYTSRVSIDQMQSSLTQSLESLSFIHKDSLAIKYFRLHDEYKNYAQIIGVLDFYLSNNEIFDDHEGPTNSNKKYTERRAEVIFKNKPFYLFQMAESVLDRQRSRVGIGQMIQPKDIIQGSIGDCYFLSSIASIVWKYPQHITKLFLFQVNPVGFYAVRLFNDGQWGTIVVDDKFLCDSHGSPAFARNHTNEIWVMLLEKAWAKINLSYQNIDLGSSLQGLISLTGAPSKYYRKQDENVMKRIQQAWQKGWIATCSGSQLLNDMKKQQTSKLGLIGKHAYSVHRLIQVIDPDTNQKLILIRLRNPWGDLEWKGDWSFKSPKWSSQLRQKYNYNKNPQDGSFYIPWKQFQKYFGSVSVCSITPGNLNSSLRIKIVRHKSTFVQMKIKTPGYYTISLYQQSKRKYKHSQNYKLSQARLIIMKQILRGSQPSYLQYVVSGNKSTSNIHLPCYLDPGTYIVSTKIAWRLFDQHEAVLTSYGPSHVDFQLFQGQKLSKNFKQHLAYSYYQKFKGKGTQSFFANKKLNIDKAYRQILVSLQHGVGYIFLANPTNKSFNCIINFKNLKGIKLFKPQSFPLTMQVKANTQHLYGLYVSGQGYSYVVEQKVKLIDN